MTILEKLKIEKPDVWINEFGPRGCPADYKYSDYKVGTSTCPLHGDPDLIPHKCLDCWNQEIPEKETYSLEEVKEMCDVTDEDIEEAVDAINEVGNPNPMTSEDVKQALEFSQKMILDSGERRQFETGAVRDIQEGKGRCDLMPLWVVGACLEDTVLMSIANYQKNGDVTYLKDAIGYFNNSHYGCPYTMFLEVSKHFEEGAKKYGENNWQKGIPTRCYIDSAVRHYLKHLRGDQDEPHDRAVVWNLLCCIWTVINKPELDSYRKDEENGTNN